MEDIKDKLKALRKQKKISQKQVAESAGISIAAYSNIESGISKSITIDVGKGIAKALGFPFTELFDVDESTSKSSENETLVKKLQQKITNLEKRIEEKDLVITSLTTNRKFFINTLIRFIEDSVRYNFYWIIKQGYDYAKTTEEKELVDKWLKEEKDKRKGMYDYFLNEKLITEVEIDQVLEQINDSYKNMDWSGTFHFLFKTKTKMDIPFQKSRTIIPK
jgi:transcriptional regulator with XRE-family HTH domain